MTGATPARTSDMIDSVRSARQAFIHELDELLRAHYPLIHIVTHEEDRAIVAISELCGEREKALFIWSTSRGIMEYNQSDRPAQSSDLRDLATALDHMEKLAEQHKNAVFLLLDPLPYLNLPQASPLYRRRLRDLAVSIRTKGYNASCLILSPSAGVPIELEKEVTVIDFPMPDRHEIAAFIGDFVERIHGIKFGAVGDPGQLVEALVDASLGLTMVEIENALAKAIVSDGRLDYSDVEWIVAQKRQIIRQSGILDYYDTRGLSLADIGGLDELKRWLEVRGPSLSLAARDFGIHTPKGVLLTGVPGCGKSLAAKCVAATWRLPLIRFDVGKIYSSLVGSSEEHMRHAIATCEAVAPCVVWVDEIEKALPRNGGHVGDSGVSLRVLGSFLTWLEEKTKSVFVFATANEISLLPPELLRKGRFDEVFFVDLPDAAERRAIIEIHLRHAKKDPEAFDLDRLTMLSGPETHGPGVSMTGAEIEAWIDEALIAAFNRAHQQNVPPVLSMADLEAVAGGLVLIAKLRREEIEELRTWAATHAVKRSSAQIVESARSGRAIEIDRPQPLRAAADMRRESAAG
jgi:ATP-dependent 26S proteasome regulatory subunit